MDQTPAPGTNVRGRARRKRLLDAAMEAFGAQGFRGTTLGDIAARAGVGEPGVLYHFRSKEQLLERVLVEHDDEDAERMAHARAAADRAMADTLLDLAARHEADPAFIRLFTIVAAESVEAEHPAHDLFVSRYRRVRADLSEWAAREQQAGRMSDAIAPEALGRLLVAILDGLELQYLLEYEERGIVEPLSQFFDLLQRGAARELSPPAS